MTQILMAPMRRLRPFLRWGYPWMVIFAIMIHFVWGYGLIVNEQVATLVSFIGLNHFIDDLGVSPSLLGIVLIIASATALWGIVHEAVWSSRRVLRWIMPQYLLMLVALLSDCWIIIAGVNSRTTGQPIDRIILVCLLWPIMAAAFLHTLSILERFVFEPRRSER